jgi:hypothetical protein
MGLATNSTNDTNQYNGIQIRLPSAMGWPRKHTKEKTATGLFFTGCFFVKICVLLWLKKIPRDTRGICILIALISAIRDEKIIVTPI